MTVLLTLEEKEKEEEGAYALRRARMANMNMRGTLRVGGVW
jgi:hypothetical protein